MAGVGVVAPDPKSIEANEVTEPRSLPSDFKLEPAPASGTSMEAEAADELFQLRRVRVGTGDLAAMEVELNLKECDLELGSWSW